CGTGPDSTVNTSAADGSAAVDAGRPADAKPVWDMTPVPGPLRLSESGLYSDFASRTLAPRVIEYTPRYELWSDGATKRRFLLLPAGAKIDTSDMDNWAFPVGTKLWKEFRRDGFLVETRLLQKVYDNPGGWYEV